MTGKCPYPHGAEAVDTGPNVVFHRAIAEGNAPMRADKTALGNIPSSALQYCAPVTTASGLGWYVFVPNTLYLQFDGQETYFLLEDADTWVPLGSEMHPRTAEHFDANVPDELKGFCPGIISRTPVAGVVQVWTGLFMSTAPGWSTLVRPPANLPRPQSYEHFEGVVDTDHWFGPLFINLRLTKTDTIIRLDEDTPIAQIMPLKREHIAPQVFSKFDVNHGLADVPAEHWANFNRRIVAPSKCPADRMPGNYAAEARKRERRQGE